MQFKLSIKMQESVADVRDSLNAEVETLRDAYSRKSEKWQESDAGQEIDCWIESLEELCDLLNEFEPTPEG